MKIALSTAQYALLASALLLALTPLQFHLLNRVDPSKEAFAALQEAGPQALETSLTGFRNGLQWDPASPFRWCDLGEAYLAAGDFDRARYCFSRGLRLGSKTPAIRFRAAMFQLRAGDLSTALDLLAGLLQQERQYEEIVFSYYDRLSLAMPQVLHSLPHDRRIANAWLQFLLRTRTPADTTEVWQWIAENSLAGDADAAAYVESLLGQQEYAAAARCWRVYMAHRQPAPRHMDLLLNGGFEDSPTGTSLDWRFSNSQAARDCTVTSSGKCSLRLSGASSVEQNLLLEPGTYRLEARVRAPEITAAQNLHLRIFDSNQRTLLESSISRSTGWTTVQQTFTVPEDSHGIELQLSLSDSVAGSVWLDDLAVAPVP